MEDPRKREGFDDGGDLAFKKSPTRTLPDTSGDLGEDILAWLSMDDETIDELMKFLDTHPEGASATCTSTTRVKFIENPYSSPLIFQSSSSYITINGNEESCGSSFSDWESSVMASVDMGGILNVGKSCGIDGFCEFFQAGKGGAWGSNEDGRGLMVAEEGGVVDGSIEGYEYDGVDGESLARFLGEGFID
ncbi:hypothetical protein P3X46_007626 [Hevea brasiliensis]|uniref:Uncharacterized protein n=1 Tax=Hevea brasiliensis TaxID=3981 RepID=A0ABQ9MY84_HEVBR|nr:uncharacterized protein LOC110650126 [Hevea brasiliensis]KAJ9183819.1 hypothetical protein P3X46_007626 [Hevea brasiliensis]